MIPPPEPERAVRASASSAVSEVRRPVRHPACMNRGELFEDPDYTDEAIAICAQCPEIDWCRSLLASLDRADLVGVWAGTLLGYEEGSRTIRLREEDRAIEPAEARTAHAAYARGWRDEATLAGERAYHRSRSRRRRAVAA